MTDGFLHLTDAEYGTPVRIRLSTIDCLYVEEGKEEVQAFHGHSPAGTVAKEPYTMIVYADGHHHGVRESIEAIEGQMADFHELAGIAALD